MPPSMAMRHYVVCVLYICINFFSLNKVGIFLVLLFHAPFSMIYGCMPGGGNNLPGFIKRGNRGEKVGNYWSG